MDYSTIGMALDPLRHIPLLVESAYPAYHSLATAFNADVTAGVCHYLVSPMSPTYSWSMSLLGLTHGTNNERMTSIDQRLPHSRATLTSSSDSPVSFAALLFLIPG